MKIFKAVAFLACLAVVWVLVGTRIPVKPQTQKSDLSLKRKHEQMKNYMPKEFHYRQEYKNKASMKYLTKGKK